MTVAVYELVREWTLYEHLCDPCVDARRAAGWTVRLRKAPQPAWCSDCERARQAAPGYVTPAVPFVATRAESRLLNRRERKARAA